MPSAPPGPAMALTSYTPRTRPSSLSRNFQCSVTTSMASTLQPVQLSSLPRRGAKRDATESLELAPPADSAVIRDVLDHLGARYGGHQGFPELQVLIQDTVNGTLRSLKGVVEDYVDRKLEEERRDVVRSSVMHLLTEEVVRVTGASAHGLMRSELACIEEEHRKAMKSLMDQRTEQEGFIGRITRLEQCVVGLEAAIKKDRIEDHAFHRRTLPHEGQIEGIAEVAPVAQDGLQTDVARLRKDLDVLQQTVKDNELQQAIDVRDLRVLHGRALNMPGCCHPGRRPGI
eukprot:CAMPEP_0172719314 /NCGR_PEP_ID=MMETSP1074-20121228/75435_1 /TAXON_ID=2916 /ORGANISM="Ceratium fusus, Strain PA161109" /LENGTH=286 /DNA_ID=CAMNT_0013544653 /DNA_START=21 /DNA_END=881 /DNA_ORIENTATION=-